MKTSSRMVAIKYGGWGILLFNILLLVFLHDYVFSSFILVLALLSWVLISSLIAVVVLPFFYQQLLWHWWYWAILLGLIVSDLGLRQDSSVSAQTLSTLIGLISLFARVALISSLSIQLIKRNFGLKLIAWLSFIWVWSTAIFMMSGGDIVENLNQAISSKPPSLAVWWITNLGLEFILLIPFALASFFWHTGCMLMREIRDASPSLR